MKQFNWRAGIATAMLCSAALATQADTLPSYFNASVSDPPQSAGMYRFSTTEYSPEQIKRNIYASGGGIANDTYYYGVRYEIVAGLPLIDRASYSLKSWGVEDSYPNGTIANVATDLAYFAPTDQAYGCFFNDNGTGYVFGKYRFGYFLCEKICDLEVAFAALDFDSKGSLFAIDWTGKLVKVDPKTGKQTEIGDTGLTTDMITGGAVDRSTDIFYFSSHKESGSALYAVDLITAKATKVYDLENDEQLCGLYFPTTYVDGAPAASSNPTLSFTSGSLTGTVRFRAPQKSVGSEPISGDVTYHIEANGLEVATGTANYDEGFKSVEVTIPEAGQYCFSLYFSNNAGRGPRSKTNQWIGPDYPKAPGSPRLTYKDGNVKVFWTAVGTTGANGGSINTSNLSYKIIRHPDMTVSMATASGWSDFIETPSERTTYKYEIRAIAGGLEGEGAFTPEFSLGPVVPPFNETFAAQPSSFGWQWINNDSYIDDNYSVSNGMRLVTMNMPDEGVYLMTPPVRAKAKTSYDISLQLRCGNSNYNEKFELIASTEASPEHMSQITIIPATDLTSTTLETFTAVFEPEVAGDYHIALHGLESGRMIYLKEFNIAKGVSHGTPAAVTELTVKADETGAHKAEISFRLPVLDSEGGDLEEITGVELLRDGNQIIFDETEHFPGEEMTFTDSFEPSVGNHVYSVTCYNATGNGPAVTATEWIGFNQPFEPEWVRAVETETIGTVSVTWAEVDSDIDDKLFNAGDVTYNIYNREGELVREGVTEQPVVIRAVEPEAGQTWAQYRVAAVSEGGEGELTKSILVPVGRPDATPWRESWAGKEASHIIGTTMNSVEDSWIIAGGFSYNGRDVDPQDNDGGMMGLENRLMDESVSLFTGKIDLTSIHSPALSFWVYNYVGDNGKENENVIDVKAWGNGDDDFKLIKSVVIGQTGPQMQWNRVVIPLTEYADGNVRLRFETSVVTAIYVHLDNIRIDTHSECNLAARNCVTPASAEPGTSFSITFDAVNTGDSDITEAYAILLCNGAEVARRQLSPLKTQQTAKVSFDYTFEMSDPDESLFECVLSAEGDLVAEDNKVSAIILVRRNGLPIPTELKAVNEEGKILLTWSAPDPTLLPPAKIAEGFESSTAWASDIDGWKLLDIDRATIGGIGKKQLPVSGQQSFFVADDTHSELNYANDGNRFKAYAGHRSLWSMYSMRGSTYVKSDDWAISPELYGGPQTISLWASSFESDPGQPQYLESFEVLTSYTGTETEDFELLAIVDNVPATWTNYEFYLPVGTKHFAIRAVSYDKYILMIDDVEFISADNLPNPLTVTGYNIWRDGKKLNSAPIAVTEYEDKEVTNGSTYSYQVSAIYSDMRESSLSDRMETRYSSGVSTILDNGIKIYAQASDIIIVGAEGQSVTVCTAEGLKLADFTASAYDRIPMAKGVYLVSISGKSIKIVI